MKGKVIQMFDRSKTVYWGSYNLTVGKLIEELSKYDKDTKVTICGDDQAYLHVDVDPDNENDFEIVLDNMSADEIEGDETVISLKEILEGGHPINIDTFKEIITGIRTTSAEELKNWGFNENGKVVTLYPLEYPEKEEMK